MYSRTYANSSNTVSIAFYDQNSLKRTFWEVKRIYYMAIMYRVIERFLKRSIAEQLTSQLNQLSKFLMGLQILDKGSPQQYN